MFEHWEEKSLKQGGKKKMRTINKPETSSTYRQIQEKYRERSRKNKLEKLQKLRENFKADKTLVIKIAQDEEIPYVD